jgi:small subunit ribosomal protein S16
MVVIRLARVGRKKLPLYRVVVADQRRAATGKFVDIIGRYNPHNKTIVLDKDKVGKWLKVGAQPSNTVAKLFQIDGVDLPAWVKVKQKNKSVKNEEKAMERASKGDQSSEETSSSDSDAQIVAASTDNIASEEIAIDASNSSVEEANVADITANAVDPKSDTQDDKKNNKEDNDSSNDK